MHPRTALLTTTVFLPISLHAASLKTHRIVPEKELLITDVDVVDSPLATYPGPLSFGHLMEKMAGKNDPSEFLKRWLLSWEKKHVVNTHPLPPRKSIRKLVIDPWKAKDGFALAPDDAWVVNYKNAPFLLLAIINRTDLAELPDPPTQLERRIPAYYKTQNSENFSGEGRFVYAALDSEGNPLPGDFTIILEYSLLGDVSRWAQEWHALGKFEEFDGSYLNQLATVTNRFTGSIRQIRTSEASFDPVREFREFALNKDGFLAPKTLVATPAARFEHLRVRTVDNDALGKYINEHADAIKAGEATYPTSLKLSTGESPRFLAARALIPPNGGSTFIWKARSTRDPEARRTFSMNTCNGCHAAETETDSCLHIHPRISGKPAKLSKFLQFGSVYRVPNPGPGGDVIRLAEMERRVEFFKTLLNPDLPFSEIQSLRKRFAAQNAH